MINLKAIGVIFSVVVVLIFLLPIVTAPTPEIAVQKGADAVVYFSIPWWIKAITAVAGIPVIGGLLVVGIVFIVMVKDRIGS